LCQKTFNRVLIPGFLVFLAIVVYWASCMGPRALKWVGILFVSGCLVMVLGIAGLLVYKHLDDARREAEQATQAKAEAARRAACFRDHVEGTEPSVDELICIVDGTPLPLAAPAALTASASGGSQGKADYERLMGTPPTRGAPRRSLTLQEHAILDTLKVELLPRRLTVRDKQEAIRLRRALVRGPLAAEDHQKLDALLQRIAAKTPAPSIAAEGLHVTQSPSPPQPVLSQTPMCETARYLDNGNGTITDCQTGLMWEKKAPDFSVVLF
jgi:hypothetical protein